MNIPFRPRSHIIDYEITLGRDFFHALYLGCDLVLCNPRWSEAERWLRHVVKVVGKNTSVGFYQPDALFLRLQCRSDTQIPAIARSTATRPRHTAPKRHFRGCLRARSNPLVQSTQRSERCPGAQHLSDPPTNRFSLAAQSSTPQLPFAGLKGHRHDKSDQSTTDLSQRLERTGRSMACAQLHSSRQRHDLRRRRRRGQDHVGYRCHRQDQSRRKSSSSIRATIPR